MIVVNIINKISKETNDDYVLIGRTAKGTSSFGPKSTGSMV